MANIHITIKETPKKFTAQEKEAVREKLQKAKVKREKMTDFFLENGARTLPVVPQFHIDSPSKRAAVVAEGRTYVVDAEDLGYVGEVTDSAKESIRIYIKEYGLLQPGTFSIFIA